MGAALLPRRVVVNSCARRAVPQEQNNNAAASAVAALAYESRAVPRQKLYRYVVPNSANCVEVQ